MKANSCTALFRFLKNGILGVLEVSEKRGKPPHPLFTIFQHCLNIFQMLSFVTANVNEYSCVRPRFPTRTAACHLS